MQIRIKGYGFTISEPFQPGTVITKGEAQALNHLRAENIQNNFRKQLVPALAELGPGEMLSQQQLAEWQQRISAYDQGYKFVEKGQRSRVSDLETETQLVAQELVEAQLRQAGREVEPAEKARLIEQASQLEHVVEEARQRVLARRRALAGSLADL